MITINCPREFFQSLATNKLYVEIGVYRGEYSKGISNYRPKHMFLIDPWDEQVESNYLPEDCKEDAEESLKKAFVDSGYYKNGLLQSLKEAYSDIKNEYFNNKDVTIMKGTSKIYCEKFKDKSIDFLFLDGNHRYDYVLADLERWSPKIANEGIIILDDAYVSQVGKMQHLSTLEALSTFIKLSDFAVVAMSTDPFSNVIITRKDNKNKLLNELKQRIVLTEYTYITIPDALIHSVSHEIIKYEFDGKIYSKEFISYD